MEDVDVDFVRLAVTERNEGQRVVSRWVRRVADSVDEVKINTLAGFD